MDSTKPPAVTTAGAPVVAPAYVLVLSLTLNIGLSAFQAVQQVFVQTIAAAAGVDPSQVTITVISLARRLLLDSGVGVNVTISAPNNGISGAVVTSSPQVLT